MIMTSGKRDRCPFSVIVFYKTCHLTHEQSGLQTRRKLLQLDCIFILLALNFKCMYKMYACIIPQKDIEFIYTKGFQTVSRAFPGWRRHT